MVDPEVVRELGPWGAGALLVLVGVVVWARSHRHYHVTLDITVQRSSTGGARMAPTKVPDGLSLFENYCTFKISDGSNHYIFAGMSKERGIVVFDTEKVLYEMPAGDWGSPALEWRPSDGQLIVISVSQGGTMIQIDAVPGVKKSG